MDEKMDYKWGQMYLIAGKSGAHGRFNIPLPAAECFLKIFFTEKGLY